jgi:hypothetical protein
MTTSVLERAPLALTDRCDRCGAQAFVRALFSTGELTFCGHHGRVFLPGLERTALYVCDGTELINSRPSPSANSD